jgi:hypothetical protein
VSIVGASRGWLFALWAVSTLGCGGSVRSSRTEDEARQLVPVPICVQRLPRRAAPGSVIALEAREYWSLLLPGFDARASMLDLSVADCSGRWTLQGNGQRGAKLAVKPDELVLGSGPDGLKAAWLPLASDTSARTGLLALLRQREQVLEVYALGVHSTAAGNSRLELERMGPALAVAALEEQCRGSAADRSCSSACTVYLMSSGRLTASARFPVDQRAQGIVAGATSRGEYRFNASPEYRSDGIALSEKLTVSEPGRGEVRSFELQRTLRLQDERLTPSAESLWVQTARQLGLPENP